MMKKNDKFFLSICIFALISAGIPAVSAWSQGQSWNDNPEHIAAMQAYVVYSGELYKAKMDGAIAYISSLNDPTGSGNLQADEQQFLTTVFSVKTVSTASAIEQGRGTMKTEIGQFRTDLQADFSADKGNLDALKKAVADAESQDQTTIQSRDNAYWTALETSRLDEFTYNDGHRTAALANLTAKGVDVNISPAC